MGIAASDLCEHVIRPTLLYLQRPSPMAESLLLGAAACQSALGSALGDQAGFGLYHISEEHHRCLWDLHLARDPELASLVRGLASQHAFLAAPHLELTVNLRYATAIAWLLIETEVLVMPAADDWIGMAAIWRQVFNPQGTPRQYLDAWQRWVGPSARVA